MQVSEATSGNLDVELAGSGNIAKASQYRVYLLISITLCHLFRCRTLGLLSTLALSRCVFNTTNAQVKAGPQIGLKKKKKSKLVI